MMKILFAEMRDWEKDYIRDNLKNAKLEFYPGKINNGNASKFRNAEIISTFIGSKLDAKALAKLSRLKMISTRSTGFDHIDVKECKKKNVQVSYVPFYGENTVAEHTFGLILMLSRKLHLAADIVKEGKFSFEGLQGFDLKGKTIGVIGTGNIGQHVIRVAKGFEMNVIAFDINKNMKAARKQGYKYVGFDQLLKKSDIVTLHVPYNKHTHHLINIGNIKLFKKGSLLINTARGGLVQTEAMMYGLRKKILAGIGLDVLEDEKMINEEMELIGNKILAKDIKIMLQNHILAEQDNVVITPHNAFNSKEAVIRILDTTIGNIKSFIKKKKVNAVRV